MTQMPIAPIPITQAIIESLFLHWFRDREFFLASRPLVEPTHFGAVGEMGYAEVWQQLCAYFDQHDQLPVAYEAFSADADARIRAAMIELDDVYQNIERMLRWIFAGAPLDTPAAYAQLRRFLLDRTVAHPLREAADGTSGRDLSELPDVLERLQQTVTRITTALDNTAVPTLGDDFGAYLDRVERQRGRQLVGLRSGMTILDNRTSGLRGMMILGAAPGSGKSVLALQVATGVCRHAGNDAVCLYLSLDMAADDVRHRLMCHLAAMDWRTWILGQRGHNPGMIGPLFTEPQQAQIDRAHQLRDEWHLNQRLAIIGRERTPQMTAATILAMVRALKRQAGAAHCLVIVDYLQLLPVPEAIAQESELEADKFRVRVVQDILDGLITADGAQRNAVLAISEARKPPPSASSDHWGTRMQDLMGSARLAFAADAVLMLKKRDEIDGTIDRQQYLDNNGIAPITLSLAKGRDGMTRGNWDCEFHYRQSRIVEGLNSSRAVPTTLPSHPTSQSRRSHLAVDEEFDV